MWDYFWTYYADLPPGVGTPNFGPVHLAWLTASFAVIVLVLLVYRRLGSRARKTAQIIMAVLLMGGDIGILTWLAASGHFSLAETLPLHLCSLAVWLEPAGVFSKSQLIREFSYGCCLPGALAAMLTPTWTIYPVLHIHYLVSILNHTLIIMIPVIWIWGDSFRPSVRRLPGCFALLLLIAGVSAVVNRLLGSNFMFLSWPPPGTILTVFERWLGNPGYILLLVALVLAAWALLYTPWLISSLIHRNKAGNA
jgi:hypothetical integral membrane protein (TIGR02206 family)